MSPVTTAITYCQNFWCFADKHADNIGAILFTATVLVFCVAFVYVAAKYG